MSLRMPVHSRSISFLTSKASSFSEVLKPSIFCALRTCSRSQSYAVLRTCAVRSWIQANGLQLSQADPSRLSLCHECSVTLLRFLRLSSTCRKPLQTDLFCLDQMYLKLKSVKLRRLGMLAVTWLSLGRSICAVSTRLFLHQCCHSTSYETSSWGYERHGIIHCWCCWHSE
jgi:hypothetical protein